MKKILTILMFLAVLGMLIGFVAAADLEPYDFKGKFTLDVPKDFDLARQAVGNPNKFSDANSDLYIEYYTIDDVKAMNCNDFDEYINECLRLDEIETDGDLTVFKDGNDYVVTVHSDEELFVIVDEDIEEAKAIASSADFSGDKSNDDTNKSSSPESGNAEMKSQDFFGFFTMDVPKNSDFGDTENYDQRVVADTVYYYDEVNNITIQYINNDAYDDGVVKNTVDGLKQQGADVSTKDNLYLISANGINEVIFHKQPKTFTIISNQIDLDTLADMASSIEITDEN